MKKINEKIIKYLSGLMEGEELKQFEQLLKTDSTLSNQFNSIKDELKIFSDCKEIETNETYFNNLVPRVKERLSEKNKLSLVKRFAYAMPVVVILITFLLFNPFPSNVFFSETENLAKEVVNNLDDEEIADKLINDFSIESSIAYNTNNNTFETYIPEDVEISLNNILKYYDVSKLDFSELQELSNQDIEKLYSKLSLVKL